MQKQLFKGSKTMFDDQTPEEMFLESMKSWAEDEHLRGEDLYTHLARVGRVNGESAMRKRLEYLIYLYLTQVLDYTFEN